MTSQPNHKSPTQKDHISVYNPYNQTLVSELKKHTQQEVRAKIETAASHRQHLKKHEMIEIFNKAISLLESDKTNAAKLITSESGLCLKDSLYEVDRVLNVFQATIYELIKNEDQIFNCDINGNQSRKVLTLREPLQGVIAAITPFNHPLNQVAHKVCPAIATNNRIILKPSEKTPLSAIYLQNLFSNAGLAENAFQVVIGDPEEIAAEMISNEKICLIAFTGSVEIGKKLHY